MILMVFLSRLEFVNGACHVTRSWVDRQCEHSLCKRKLGIGVGRAFQLECAELIHLQSIMVPHLTTALTGPLLDLERRFQG